MNIRTLDLFVILDFDYTLFDTRGYQDYRNLYPTGGINSSPTFHIEGADALLAFLEENNIPFGIMSYGDIELQEEKLRVAQWDKIPHLITNTPEKSILIRQWQQKDSSFAIPSALSQVPAEAKHLFLLDDKAITFTDIGDGLKGFLFRRKGYPILEVQKGFVPSEVKVIEQLEDLTQFFSFPIS